MAILQYGGIAFLDSRSRLCAQSIVQAECNQARLLAIVTRRAIASVDQGDVMYAGIFLLTKKNIHLLAKKVLTEPGSSLN